MDTELLQEFVDAQREVWPLAADNYAALREVERRPFRVGPLEGAFQFNPRRALSTGAKTDAASIAARPCFLCSANRPSEQLALPFLDDWEILVNPYPILPFHFTVAARSHRPQGEIPLEMVSLAEQCRGVCTFFNGAKAGASAPDHEHFQMVLKSELPLVRYLESGGDPGLLPMAVDYYVVTPDLEGMEMLRRFSETKGRNSGGGPDRDLLNAYAWLGDDGLMRLAAVRRRAHRPRCYYSAGAEHRMVSPGAIDMAGLVILPRRGDYEEITDAEMRQIYSEV